MWGNLVTTAFSTEEGAFLRGQVRMEEKLELNLDEQPVEAEKPLVPEEEKEPKKVPEKRSRKVA